MLLSRWHIGHLTEADIALSQTYALEAIELDPRLSSAHATLALAKLHAMLHRWRPDTKVVIAEAIAHGQEAIRVDDADASAHTILGMAYMFGRQYEKGPVHLTRALSLNPKLANAWGVFAAYHGVSRNYERAKAHAEKATQLSPRDPYRAFWYGGHGIAAYLDGNYEVCIDVCQTILAEFPGYASCLRQLAAAQAMSGDIDAAQNTMQRLLQGMPDLTVSLVHDMVPIRFPDDHERWLEGLRRAGLPD